jgi:hypothetical protein
MDEARIRHLEMIQRVVDRLARNCFAVKTWSVTVVSAIFVLSAKDAQEGYAVLALFPALCFWGLDAYYLREERLFRELHKEVAQGSTRQDAKNPIASFSLDTAPVADRVPGWANTLLAPAVLWLHIPILAAVIAVTVCALLW